ncbi:MAG: hypothetical protein AAGI68_07220 [Planctomycetota bacterium]
MKHPLFLIALIALPLHAQPATQPTIDDLLRQAKTARGPDDPSPLPQAIAQRHGLDAWPTVTQLDFTFNVKTPKREIARQWSWRPHDHQVTRTINDQPLTFDPTTVTTESPGPILAAHKEFINDTYWLLFPFQLVWSNPTVTPFGLVDTPIAKTPAIRMDVTYPTGGYTPGDTYQLYLQPDGGLIREWTFARPNKPDRHFAFQDPVTLGPLLTYLNHPTADGSVNVFFTNLSIQTTTSDTPIKPVPLVTD